MSYIDMCNMYQCRVEPSSVGAEHIVRKRVSHPEQPRVGRHSRLTMASLQRKYADSEYLCSADGSTHRESNTLYRKVKHRARPNLSSRQRPKHAPIRRRSRRRQRRGEPRTEHGLGVLLAAYYSVSVKGIHAYTLYRVRVNPPRAAARRPPPQAGGGRPMWETCGQ